MTVEPWITLIVLVVTFVVVATERIPAGRRGASAVDSPGCV
jgi:Sec-independent protein translocase protein TatA